MLMQFRVLSVNDVADNVSMSYATTCISLFY